MSQQLRRTTAHDPLNSTCQPGARIKVPPGASVADMKALRGSKNIDDGMDTIIARIAEENDLSGVIDRAFFNDPEKCGRDHKMVNTLTALINFFSSG